VLSAMSKLCLIFFLSIIVRRGGYVLIALDGAFCPVVAGLAAAPGLRGFTTYSESTSVVFFATVFASLRTFIRPSCLSSLSINFRISSLSFWSFSM